MILNFKIKKLFLSIAAVLCLNGLLISVNAAKYDVEDFKEMIEFCEFGRFGLDFSVATYVQMKIDYLKALHEVVLEKKQLLEKSFKEVEKLLKSSGLLHGSVLPEVKFLCRHSKTYAELEQNFSGLIMAYDWFNSQRR